MGTLKKWQFCSKLGSQPPLKSSRIVSRKKAVFRAFFSSENHFLDPFRHNEDPQVLNMAGKLWISSLWWYKEKNIFLHPVERMIFWDAPHRYFPLYWEAVVSISWGPQGALKGPFFTQNAHFGGLRNFEICPLLGVNIDDQKNLT